MLSRELDNMHTSLFMINHRFPTEKSNLFYKEEAAHICLLSKYHYMTFYYEHFTCFYSHATGVNMKGNATVILEIKPKGVTAKDKFIKIAKKTSLVSKK